MNSVQIVAASGRSIVASIFNFDGLIWNGSAFEVFATAALQFPAIVSDPVSGHYIPVPQTGTLTPTVGMYEYVPSGLLVGAAGDSSLRVVALDMTFDSKLGSKIGEGCLTDCDTSVPQGLTLEQYNNLLNEIATLGVLATPPPIVNDLTGDPGAVSRTLRIPNCERNGFVAGATVWVSSDAQNRTSVIPAPVTTDANGYTPPISLPPGDYYVFWRTGTTSESELMTW